MWILTWNVRDNVVLHNTRNISDVNKIQIKLQFLKLTLSLEICQNKLVVYVSNHESRNDDSSKKMCNYGVEKTYVPMNVHWKSRKQEIGNRYTFDIFFESS